MVELVNHPGMFLNDEAAASLARFETDHGVQPISEAGRTEEYQQGLIDRWNEGGKYNRPPYLYEPRRPAKESDHVKNKGQAVDTPNWAYWRREAADYGWLVDYDWDVVHFRYDRASDKHIPEPKKEEDEMTPEQWDFLQKMNVKIDGIASGIAVLAVAIKAPETLTPGMNDKLDNLQSAAEKLLAAEKESE